MFLLQMVWRFTDIDAVLGKGSSQVIHSQSLFLLQKEWWLEQNSVTRAKFTLRDAALRAASEEPVEAEACLILLNCIASIATSLINF